MKRITIPVLLVAVMWIIWIVFGTGAISYGIHPRDVSSIKGIFFASFIHGNTQHIMSNTLPILVLSIVIAVFYNRLWLIIWTLITLTGGILVWLFARATANGVPTYHVGASLTIFGLIGFLLAIGIFKHKFRDIIISVIVALLYGGALYGILPTNPAISYEAHLFGFISGVWWAYVFRKTNLSGKEKKEEVLPDKNI